MPFGYLLFGCPVSTALWVPHGPNAKIIPVHRSFARCLGDDNGKLVM